jgi:hypothetical protein
MPNKNLAGLTNTWVLSHNQTYNEVLEALTYSQFVFDGIPTVVFMITDYLKLAK